jgi:hypothetical protein
MGGRERFSILCSTTLKGWLWLYGHARAEYAIEYTIEYMSQRSFWENNR